MSLFFSIFIVLIAGLLMYAIGGSILEQVCVGTFGAWTKWPFRMVYMPLPVIVFYLPRYL